MQNIFKEFIVAPLTPFKEDGTVHYEIIPEYADFLFRSGAKGVFINGTTGEGLSLTQKERLKVSEVWRSATQGKMKLLVSIAGTSMPLIRECGKHAQSIGADAISTLGPIYYPVQSIEDFVNFCAISAESAAETPFYYYHIPSLTKTTLTASEFLTCAIGKIPNLAGIKYTCTDLLDLGRVCALSKNKLEIYYGFDELLLPSLCYPVAGAIGSTYNFMLPLYQSLVEAFFSGDQAEALRLQNQAIAIIDVLKKYGVIASQKAILSYLGIEMGICRPPINTLSDIESHSLIGELKATGIEGFLLYR